MSRAPVRCRFVPPYLLERVAALHQDEWATSCCRGTLAMDAGLRDRRTATAAGAVGPPTARTGPFAVYDAHNGTELPGTLARSAGEGPAGDEAVDEAHAGVKGSLALFREVFGRDSYDGRGAPVVATVHYGRAYDNAFWDGRQLVFGDGDGRVFTRFTKPVDVLGHEFTHAVTQHTAGLEYSGQPGALNESMSDVFAACLKQRLLGQASADADWLVGEGIFLPGVAGRALRSMAEPGTAYDDPVLGKDPQVGSMADYVVTQQDNGGVHLNSGIPNRAFQLAAVALGGASWETVGPIWWAALTSGIGPTTDFAGFAAATLAAARDVSDAALGVVRDAWAAVGVVPVGAGLPARTGGVPGVGVPGPGPGAGQSGGQVAVTRTGGIAGMRRTAELRLGDDPRTPEVEQLLAGIDVRAVVTTPPQPDRYIYEFRFDGDEVVVGEQDLTPELESLARLLLDPPG